MVANRGAVCCAVVSLAIAGLSAFAGEDAKEAPKVDAKDRAILETLEEPIPLNFKGAPLIDVLKFIKSATEGPDGVGVPIHVDPEALNQAGMTVEAKVSVVSAEGEPLKKSLGRLLDSKGLAYKVEGGLLKIVAGAKTPGRGQVERIDRGPQTRAILAKLEKPLEMHFKGAALEDVLKFIKAATQAPGDNGVPIYVDPVGLQEEGATMTSPVSIDAKDEPLKASLRRLLKPLGLTYVVKDGLLTVTSQSAEDVPVGDKR